KLVQDGTGFTTGTLDAVAYAGALVLANYPSHEAFRRGAAREVTYAHLFNEPAEYRGQVVRLKGRLRRVNALKPPPEAAAEGVGALYEARGGGGADGAHPVRAGLLG